MTRSAAILILGLLLSFRASGGEAKVIASAEEKTVVSWDVSAEVTGIGDSTFRRHNDIGDVSTIDTQFHAIASTQLHPAFLLRFGLELQRFDFGLPDNAPLPNNLESLGLVIGGDFQLGDSWLVRLDVHPGFYSANGHYDIGDFNIPLTLGGSYFVSSDLQLVLGMSIDYNRKYPVLPAAGVRWKFAREWVLDAILPTPRLEYSLNQKITLYAGADFRGETYRVDGEFGNSHEISKLNNAFVDYTQIRAGVGASWKVSPYLNVELEAGYVPVHDFDYHRADTAVRSQEAPPYARIGFQAQF
jgi:hypothetical protein